jgi:primase-polymerase (primpol)-like protein
MIPSTMKAERRWLLWRYETLAGGRSTKVPLRVDDGRRASTTNPGHFATYESATRAAPRAQADGLGFVLAPNLPAIDLDHVRDPQTGAIVAWAARVIARLNTYTEISPSGSGFHVFFCGRKPAGRCNLRFEDGTAFEIYDQGRFFTVTGTHVSGTPSDLRAVPDAVVDAVHAEMLQRLPVKSKALGDRSALSDPVTLDDADLLRRMFKSRAGAELARLYHGDFSGYGSQSDADIRLAGALAFWCGCDVAQMDRLFRASGLMREKWNTRRGDSTYGAETIARACSGCTVTLSRR